MAMLICSATGTIMSSDEMQEQRAKTQERTAAERRSADSFNAIRKAIDTVAHQADSHAHPARGRSSAKTGMAAEPSGSSEVEETSADLLRLLILRFR